MLVQVVYVFKINKTTYNELRGSHIKIDYSGSHHHVPLDDASNPKTALASSFWQI